MDQIPNVLGTRLYQLDRERLTALAESLCSELTARGGYFGGVRPDNISYTDDGNVKLGVPADASAEKRGTDELEFMAPEVFWSGAQSPAADVYSVGMLLYAGVTNGLLPFYPPQPTPGDRADALKRRMNGEALPMPRSAGKELAEIIRKATTFRAEDRYPTPEALRAALTQYRADLRASIPTAREMFDKPEQELSDVERMMLNILAANAVDVGEEPTNAVEQEPAEEQDIEVEVVEMEPEVEPLPPEVEEAAAAIERRSSKPQETIIVVPHPKAQLPDTPAEKKSAPAEPEKKAEPAVPEKKSAEAKTAPEKKSAEKPVKKPAPEKKADAPARKKVPAQRSDYERAREREADKVSDRVEELGWLGKDKEKKKRSGQIAVIVLLLLVAAALLVLILNQLGYISFGGGDNPPDVVVESTVPVETATPEPEPTETPEPEPTETPEPEPTPTGVSTYELVMSNASWEQAKAEAEAKGGHLVVIDSPEELMQVAQLAAANGAEYVWLGLYRDAANELVWVVPSETPFYQWAQGEPSVSDSATGAPENYVILRNMNGTWYYNDIMNDPVTNYPQFFGGRVAYIVEYQT